MTETQAKSGTSMNPVDRDDQEADEVALDHQIDRTAVGRASVPVENPVTIKTEQTPSGVPATEAEAVSVTTSTSTLPGRRPETRNDRGTVPGSVGSTGSIPTVSPGKPAIGRTTSVTDAPSPSTGAARVADAVRTAKATVSSAASRGPRRARLFVKRIDPWSVMKFSFAVSFVLFFVFVVATSVLYLALDSMSVFTSVNKAIAEVVGGNKDVKITAGVVIGASGAIGLVMVVLLTALATLGAFIYNVCADLVGGIEVTLSEKE